MKITSFLTSFLKNALIPKTRKRELPLFVEVIKVGKKEAGRVFTKTVTSKIKVWGAPKLASYIGVAVAFALEYADVGGQIAKQIDKRDKRPNDGWLDLC
ncbi:hypothetical protein [Oceanobacillus chungangensis]|uniref:Uncharacterized protein n=1 Tax=Oceanobacillus chungangensis TaxID=1229152 RepID=A0A3D8PWG8_9BACI|nr:hypothetical protein [Oceanobacillus chungangensis]RDW19671.1 hypothetical protein CWR45_06215 [Oceanobacillus chungangensis]